MVKVEARVLEFAINYSEDMYLVWVRVFNVAHERLCFFWRAFETDAEYNIFWTMYPVSPQYMEYVLLYRVYYRRMAVLQFLVYLQN